jgi:hypothetical protein
VTRIGNPIAYCRWRKEDENDVWIVHHLLGGDRRLVDVGRVSRPSRARRRISNVFAAPQTRMDPAEEILRGRLARGEMAAEEYERALRVLKG